MRKHLTMILTCIMLAGCAGFQRSCSSFTAQNFSTNWLVVQYSYNGVPINCWQLHNVSIANEAHSDGIYWLDDHSGNLVHISGWYNRVQVSRNWEDAAKTLAINLKGCDDGAYNASAK